MAEPKQRSSSLEGKRLFVVFNFNYISLKNWTDFVYIAEGRS